MTESDTPAPELATPSTRANTSSTRSAARACLSAEEFQALHRLSPIALSASVAATWAWILGSIWIAARWPGPGTFAIAFFIIATRQHALNSLVHEAAHYGFSKNRFWNDLISDVICAAPHGISTAGYRAKHMKHHSHLGHPVYDVEEKIRYVIRWPRIFRWVFRSLTGHAFFVAARQYFPSLLGHGPKRGADREAAESEPAAPVAPGDSGISVRAALLIVVMNGLLFLFCWSLGQPWLMPLLWWLPLCTLTLTIGMLRVIAEHQTVEYAERGVEDFDQPIEHFTRTITAGPIERFVFAPVNFCYHHEHHLFPQVPFHNLRKAHRLLRDRGYFEAHPECVESSYASVLLRLVNPVRAVAREKVQA